MALYKEDSQASGAGSAAAAKIYKPAGSGSVNVIKDYTWTLTPQKGRVEIPSIILTEYEVDESTITQQKEFYFTGVRRGTGLGRAAVDVLSPYDELFPKDKPTGFEYIFPYYSEINFEVNTPQWQSLDGLEAAKRGAGEAISVVSPALGGAFEQGVDFLTGLGGAIGAYNYPKFGIMDRPKLWSHHEFRTYTVKFPLYNTYNTDPSRPGGEWIKNRQLCELLINQNLYNKLSFITGIPPVFYEVLIPGQHYAYAACVTNISIYNRGNLRQLSNDNVLSNVPDVYDVNITITDLVIPSKNQFQAINQETVRVESRERSGGGVAEPDPDDSTPAPVPSPSPTPRPSPRARRPVSPPTFRPQPPD